MPEQLSPSSLILLVDDNPSNLRILMKLLSQQGYQTLSATSGSEALDLTFNHAPDLILLDILMPGMDGFEVCQKLKAHPQTTAIPVIMLTALNDATEKVKAFQHGAADYVTKPFEFDELLARVHHQLALRAAETKLQRLNEELEQRVISRTQELADANTQLKALALYDALTGLPNRYQFLQQLKEAMAAAQANPEQTFAVLFLDCDRFKLINDALGYQAGDKLLREIAHRLAVLLAEIPHTLACFGGDEFGILLPGTTSGGAIAAANTLLKGFDSPFCIATQEIYISISVGIVLGPDHYQEAEYLLRDADTAMDRAKANGKGRYSLFQAFMHTSALQSLKLETDLRRSIAAEAFTVFYQPIVNLTTGEIASMEALVRWQHPHRGIVSPAEFVELAEEANLMACIDRFVLRCACYQLRTWQEKGQFDKTVTVSVNLSARQITQPDFLDNIDQILTLTGLPSANLHLEITENSIIEDTDISKVHLEGLRKRQIQVSIDDFGTGYSSLRYLHTLPVDYLKLDRSFVQPLNGTLQNLSIVPLVINIANAMRLEVIAEGIETIKQLAQLKQLGCAFGQGYFFSRPIDPDDLPTLLAKQKTWLQPLA